MGASPSLGTPRPDTWTKRLAATGGNSGNQVIAYGLLKTLAYDSVSWDHSRGPEYVNANFDHIVIAAANFLFEAFDFGGMANFIERTNLPLSIIGLGAQSNDYSSDVKLLPGTERFLSLVAERAARIGVRGDFTGSVLTKRGIKNFQVTGCPSFYMSRNAGLHFRCNAGEKNLKVAINASRDVLKHTFDKDVMWRVIRRLVSEAVQYDALFVAQTEAQEITLADEQGGAAALNACNALASLFAGVADDRKLRSWLRTRMRIYWDVDDWLDEMRTVDFVVGTRFHGGMVGLQAGAPTVVISHDTRVSEMCEFFHVPQVDIRELDEFDIPSLLLTFDPTKVKARYDALLPHYRDFLLANGLVPAW
ncbi:polysaccharide pyruvyl transferase family protein [Methylocystis sp. JAN1]|uniref:polysaccharide pyruvyl transferase family protein n=1 Tax=Methylocystis sp. JAN1 TaxID=3397211 RepID=UPI003FA23AEB